MWYRTWSGIVVMVLAVAAGRPAQGAKIWESTFPDGNVDGVVNVRTDNPVGTTMIGSSAGANQEIVTESLNTTLSNKAGRTVTDAVLTPVTLGSGDSFSALYRFSWTRLETNGTAGVDCFAGFTSPASPHSTRQFMGARIVRTIDVGGNHLINLGGGWGSEGFTGSGRNFAGNVNLGNDAALLNLPLQLAISFDGTTKVLKVALYAADATLLSQAQGDIRQFDNLGVPPNDPALTNELNALALTHLGWTDFIGESDNKETAWSVDSLAFYDDPQGAFTDVGISPTGACCHVDGTCSDSTSFECDYQFQGTGTDCGSTVCTAPLGACCDRLGGCTETTITACADFWQGPDTNCVDAGCEPVGACCLNDGTCSEGTEATCLGAYQGDGTLCESVSCPAVPTGACCASDGTCTEEPVGTCDGQWQGVGTTCGASVCPVSPLGACCGLDGTCAENVREADCCGAWQGEGTTCGGSDCASLPVPDWLATFDSDADGVVDVRDDNPNKVMIGGNTGGRQSITTMARSTTVSDKAGRALPAARGASDSFSGLYKFKYVDYPLPAQEGVAAEEIAGFISASSTHCTRQFLTSAFQHYAQGGDYHISFGVRWGSEGFTGTGRRFADVNFGPTSPLGRNLLLVVGYDGETKNGFSGLYDAIDRTPLAIVGGDIRTFDNLGVSPNDPALQNELNFLNLTHLGWVDFISDSAANNIPRTWSVDALAYFDTSNGAFRALGVESPFVGACCHPDTTCTDATPVDLCDGEWRGLGTTCAEVSCLPSCNTPSFDADGDGDVDHDDFGAVQRCITGAGDPGGSFDPSACHCFDVDDGGVGDGDVDMADYFAFQACAQGPTVPASPDCVAP